MKNTRLTLFLSALFVWGSFFVAQTAVMAIPLSAPMIELPTAGVNTPVLVEGTINRFPDVPPLEERLATQLQPPGSPGTDGQTGTDRDDSPGTNSETPGRVIPGRETPTSWWRRIPSFVVGLFSGPANNTPPPRPVIGGDGMARLDGEEFSACLIHGPTQMTSSLWYLPEEAPPPLAQSPPTVQTSSLIRMHNFRVLSYDWTFANNTLRTTKPSWNRVPQRQAYVMFPTAGRWMVTIHPWNSWELHQYEQRTYTWTHPVTEVIMTSVYYVHIGYIRTVEGRHASQPMQTFRILVVRPNERILVPGDTQQFFESDFELIR